MLKKRSQSFDNPDQDLFATVSGHTMRTLLVEDDSTTRHLLTELLTVNGHEVTAVADVEAALEKYSADPFPLVVTDWLISGGQQDGLDLCRAIRSQPDGADVFLLVVTVRDAPEDLETVLDAGADDYITKPIEAATFRIRLRVARERITIRRERGDALGAVRAVVGHAPLILMTVDPKGRFTFAEGQGLASIGKTTAEMIGKTCEEVYPQNPVMRDHINAALRGETSLSEIEINDVVLESWFAPAPVGSMNSGGAIVVCSDVTGRKRIEQEISEGEERFRRFSEAAFEGIAVVKNGKIVDCNDQIAKIFGYPPGELRSYQLSELIHPEDRADLMEFVTRMPDRPHHHRGVKKDGTTVPVEVRIRPMKLRGEDVMVAAIQDITARETAAAERANLVERLEQAKRLEALGVMAGGIAHDFNNLLMGVLGNASLALMESPPDSPQVQFIKRIEDSARRAADLTNQMLAFSGRSVLEMKLVDLSGIVNDAKEDLEQRLPPGITLELALDDHLPQVSADSRHTAHAIRNLVTNAMESYGGEPGSILIRTGVRRVDADILDRASASAGEACNGECAFVDIEDRGHGMDSKTVNRIFDPFFSTKFAGRGIGLAAVMGTVGSHEGSIAVNSAPGKGTTVSMFFPIPKPQEQIPIPSPRSSRASGLATVLIIDDEPGVRDVTRVMLEKHGYAVMTAGTGQAGIDLFKSRASVVSVTLLDLTMPDLSGAEVFSQIRQIDPDARIVLMSGYDEEQATQDFSHVGLSGFLQKPFTASAIVEKMGQINQPSET